MKHIKRFNEMNESIAPIDYNIIDGEIEDAFDTAMNMDNADDAIDFIRDYFRNNEGIAQNNLYIKKLKEFHEWFNKKGYSKNKMVRRGNDISDDDVKSVAATKKTGDEKRDWFEAQEELIRKKYPYYGK